MPAPSLAIPINDAAAPVGRVAAQGAVSDRHASRLQLAMPPPELPLIVLLVTVSVALPAARPAPLAMPRPELPLIVLLVTIIVALPPMPPLPTPPSELPLNRAVADCHRRAGLGAAVADAAAGVAANRAAGDRHRRATVEAIVEDAAAGVAANCAVAQRQCAAIVIDAAAGVVGGVAICNS